MTSQGRWKLVTVKGLELWSHSNDVIFVPRLESCNYRSRWWSTWHVIGILWIAPSSLFSRIGCLVLTIIDYRHFVLLFNQILIYIWHNTLYLKRSNQITSTCCLSISRNVLCFLTSNKIFLSSRFRTNISFIAAFYIKNMKPITTIYIAEVLTVRNQYCVKCALRSISKSIYRIRCINIYFQRNETTHERLL